MAPRFLGGMVPVFSNTPLIGDVIITARGHIPDRASTLPQPTASVVTVAAVGVTLAAGTYRCIVTQRNQWGETLGATEVSGLVVSAVAGIQVTSTLLPGAVSIRAYLTLPGGAAGSECQFSESTTSPFTITTPPTNAGVPPSQSTAYLPDSDGNAFSAATMYSWLNEGLRKLSRAVGGLLDYCGVPTQAGNPLYVLPGNWLQITDVWYGGYWIIGGKRGDFFRRNQVTSGVLNAATVSIFTDKQVIEVSYQPDRNAGVTTLGADLTAAATSGTVNNVLAFLLPFGFAQIGTEIVAYAGLNSSTGVMSGLIRGIGGSVAAAWPNGTTVTELSLFWCGKRIFNTNYAPGSGASVLPCPLGWSDLLVLYLRAKAKASEQDDQGEDRLMKQFFQEAKDWMSSNVKPPSFVQVGGSNVPMTYGNTPAGGLILP